MTARSRLLPAAAGLTLGLTVLGAVAACSSGGGAPDLDGRSFTATEVRGHDLVEGSAIKLSFEDGRISAQAGCNTLVGGAAWDGGTLEITDQLASTMMACEDALMDQDEWLSGFLTSSPVLDLDDGTLELGDDTTGITLTED